MVHLNNFFFWLFWGVWFGDWGWGMGDWAQSPIPNPQSPIPNPQNIIITSTIKIKYKLLLLNI